MAKGVRLDIRLAEWEMDLLKGMAEGRGLTLSGFVRSVLFEGAARVAEGAVELPKVIAAPARKVSLPPVKARRKTAAQSIATYEALNPIDPAVQAFAEKLGPAMVEDAAEILRPERPVPPDFDEDPLDSPGQTLEKVMDKAMDDLMEKSRPSDADTLEGIRDGAEQLEKGQRVPFLPPVSQLEPRTARKPRPGFKRAAKCTSSKCERLQAPTCDACIHANADGVGEFEIWDREVPPGPTPSTIGWTGAVPHKSVFNRHPKCVTEKCERMGPCCELCRQANAVSF